MYRILYIPGGAGFPPSTLVLVVTVLERKVDQENGDAIIQT